VGDSFSLAGAAKFIRLPPWPAKSAWARLFAGEARCLNYFRSLTRENISVRCLIFTAPVSSLLNPRKTEVVKT
jgi:hypothetical protein